MHYAISSLEKPEENSEMTEEEFREELLRPYASYLLSLDEFKDLKVPESLKDYQLSKSEKEKLSVYHALSATQIKTPETPQEAFYELLKNYEIVRSMDLLFGLDQESKTDIRERIPQHKKSPNNPRADLETRLN